ncbi:MAG: hypothetical protein V1659_05795 [Candidatus Woesearchaeota archaeon]
MLERRFTKKAIEKLKDSRSEAVLANRKGLVQSIIEEGIKISANIPDDVFLNNREIGVRIEVSFHK